jgi:hypothetical protein
MLDINNNKIELTSNNIVNRNIGFQEYVDVLGNSHSDILIKNIDKEELEFAYELNYEVVYNNILFEPWAIGRFCVEQDRISLYTNDPEQAENYGFTKEAKFVYKKEVNLDEIEALIEIKVPILKFSYMKEERTKITQKSMRSYLLNTFNL